MRAVFPRNFAPTGFYLSPQIPEPTGYRDAGTEPYATSLRKSCDITGRRIHCVRTCKANLTAV